jgi:hypothetical protein
LDRILVNLPLDVYSTERYQYRHGHVDGEKLPVLLLHFENSSLRKRAAPPNFRILTSQTNEDFRRIMAALEQDADVYFSGTYHGTTAGIYGKKPYKKFIGVLD